MHPKTLYYYSRHKLYQYKAKAVDFGRRMLPQKKHVLFSFGGRTGYWTGIGSELYAKEEVFHNSLRNCDVIIRELGGNSILSSFEKKDADFFKEESNVLFGLASLQIASFELLKSKGILPNAVLGISLGEITAAYAAGALSLKDALKVVASSAQISKKTSGGYITLYLQTDFENAKKICQSCPIPLSVIYEINDYGVLAFCRLDEKEIVTDFLDRHHIAWHMPHKYVCYPYHTDLILPHERYLKSFEKDIELQPLQCNFYSSIQGTIVPEGSFIQRDFWFDLKSRPVLAHSVLQKITSAQFQFVLHVGPESLLNTHTIQIKNRGIKLLDSFLPEKSEIKVFERTERQLIKTKLQPSSLVPYQNNALQHFITKINFYNLQAIPDPLPYLQFLQKKGSVHYLPQHQEWLVLDYEDIDYVLKTPEIFSSTIHKHLDAYLFGADPPSHTQIRALLQPLFSQQRFNMVAEYINEKATELVRNIEEKPSFNFADEFSLPLTQAAIARFIGFTEEEGHKIQQCLEGHPYEMRFFESLGQYCEHYLKNEEASKHNQLATMLLSYVREEKIPFDGAVSLMRILWFAGMITTSMLMSTAVFYLLRDPELAEEINEDEQLLNRFIEECLRLDAPETEARRITTKETILAGKTLPAGSVVVLKLKAANRDPKYFENPERICLDRTSRKHLSFGGGSHYCLGAGMARLEAKAVLKVLLKEIKGWSIDKSGVEYFLSNHFRAIKNLPITINCNL